MNKALEKYTTKELKAMLDSCNSLTTRLELRREIQARKCPKAVAKAMQVLRRRVRFDGACLHLPDSPYMQEDTEVIRKATRTFVESWIVPILDAIESHDLERLKDYTYAERGHEIEGKEWAE